MAIAVQAMIASLVQTMADAEKACFFTGFFTALTLVPRALGLSGGVEKVLFWLGLSQLGMQSATIQECAQ